MWIFANSKPMATAGALDDDQLPVTTMTIEDDDNHSNDKVGRNVDDNNRSEHNDTMTAMAIPARRSAMGDAMAAMSAMGNATSADMITTSLAPPTKCVQFCDQPVRQLVHKLRALDIG